MTGVQFVTDVKGRKTAVVLDLKTHAAIWEDIQDVLVAKARRSAKSVTLERVKADLAKQGRLRG